MIMYIVESVNTAVGISPKRMGTLEWLTAPGRGCSQHAGILPEHHGHGRVWYSTHASTPKFSLSPYLWWPWPGAWAAGGPVDRPSIGRLLAPTNTSCGSGVDLHWSTGVVQVVVSGHTAVVIQKQYHHLGYSTTILTSSSLLLSSLWSLSIIVSSSTSSCPGCKGDI